MNTDEDGYFGRECPIPECLGYFKVTPGTGIATPGPCHCPYCGHSGDNDTFWTQEQLDYARSIAMHTVAGALRQDLKAMEFTQRPRGNFGIGISLKFKPGAPIPIRHYKEKALETEIVCDDCTLRYAIYGVFGWCPDCGMHNSLQILNKNLELAKKQLRLAEKVEKELADALENVVSAFDGFGRETCARTGTEIPFQNLAGARRKVRDAFGFDFGDALAPDQWESITRVFQKRHLLAHKMGVVDDDYLKKANDPDAVLGRKVNVHSQEVSAAISLVEALGKRLFNGRCGRRRNIRVRLPRHQNRCNRQISFSRSKRSV